MVKQCVEHAHMGCTVYFSACTHNSSCNMDVQICSNTSWYSVCLQELVVVTSMQWRWPITNVPAMAIWGDGVCGLGLKQHFHTAARQLLYPLSHQPFVIADLINVAELWTVVEYAYCFLQFSWHCIAQSKLISMCCHGTAKCVTLFETLHSSLFALTQ